jgi:hypothetical protein
MVHQLREWFNEMMMFLVLLWVFGSTIYHNHFDKELIALQQEFRTNEIQKEESNGLLFTDQKRKLKRDMILHKKDQYLTNICAIGVGNWQKLDLNTGMTNDVLTLALYVNLKPVCSIFSQ